MATGVYNRGTARVLAGTTQLASSPIKAMLVESGFEFDPAHNVVADIVAHEVSGTGYTGGHAGVGRLALADRVVTEDDDDGGSALAAAALEWDGINVGAIAGVVVFHELASDAASVLISFHAVGSGDLATDGGDISLTVSTAGLLRLSAA